MKSNFSIWAVVLSPLFRLISLRQYSFNIFFSSFPSFLFSFLKRVSSWVGPGPFCSPSIARSVKQMVGSDSLLREHLVNWNVFYIFFLETFNIQRQRKYVWLRMWCHRTAVTPMLNKSLDPLMFFHRSKKIRLFFGDPGTEYSILSNKKRHFIPHSQRAPNLLN